MIYIDNFIITVPTDKDIEDVINELRRHYDLKDLNKPKQYLNYALYRDYNRRTITILQKAYVQKVLRTTNLGLG